MGVYHLLNMLKADSRINKHSVSLMVNKLFPNEDGKPDQLNAFLEGNEQKYRSVGNILNKISENQMMNPRTLRMKRKGLSTGSNTKQSQSKPNKNGGQKACHDPDEEYVPEDQVKHK